MDHEISTIWSVFLELELEPEFSRVELCLGLASLLAVQPTPVSLEIVEDSEPPACPTLLFVNP